MKACFWWDSKSQHLFGWGSEKSSVSPCSARGNAIPGCMGFYEKQLYVEKGRWREPEKERQHGKEGDREWEKDGGRQKDRGEEGESGKRWSYGGWNYEEWRPNDKVRCLMRNTISGMRARRKWKLVFYMTFSPLRACSRPPKRWSVFIIIELEKKKSIHTHHIHTEDFCPSSASERGQLCCGSRPPGSSPVSQMAEPPHPSRDNKQLADMCCCCPPLKRAPVCLCVFSTRQAVKLQTYEGVLTGSASNQADI